jgi:hypothetical protein
MERSSAFNLWVEALTFGTEKLTGGIGAQADSSATAPITMAIFLIFSPG